ncbi:MAG TPA: YncE family protein [Lacunisphaera sp.]|jgi:YVTN family beta-propeller protein|nr:YncE family protein [Lacunisphaera sp.]
MRPFPLSSTAAVATIVLALGFVPRLVADGPYHFLKEIPIGGDGGWDYLSVDPAAHRLYVSHGTEVVVVDTARDEVVGTIADTPGVHGLAVAADLQRGFTTNGRENKVGIVDLATLRTLAKVDTGANPDGMLYVGSTHEVYAFNGRGQSVTIIDAPTGRVAATVPLGGKPEFATVDEAAGRVYDNLEDRSEIVVLDAHSHAVVAHWPIAPGEEASGMAIDVAHHRLFLGCGNQLMAMVDSTNGRVVATVPIGRGVDANAFDPGTGLAFASCGDGTVTVAREETPDKLTVVQTLVTEPRARTMTLDPVTHRIYLATAKFEAPAETAAEGRRSRPKMVPGSFKVLVYGMN